MQLPDDLISLYFVAIVRDILRTFNVGEFGGSSNTTCQRSSYEIHFVEESRLRHYLRVFGGSVTPVTMGETR
jgi:hypothetical protein